MTGKTTDILISGGGVPGLALGILLARQGVEIAIVDPAPPPAKRKPLPDSRTSALMQGSIAILEQTGIWEDCLPHGGVMETLSIIDDSAKGTKIDFRSSEIGQDYFGVNLPNAVLRDILLERAAKTKNLRLIHGAKITGFTADEYGVRAEIEGAPDLCARLIVGADGRNSAVRACANIKTSEKDYGQSAITCLIDHSRPHDNISTEFHRPSGPFTLVPLPGNTSSVVWVDYTGPADAIMRLDKKSFTQALQDRSKNTLGKITLAVPPSSWPLVSLKAQSLTAPRTALIAEAAHVLHPLGAQGLNLSLRDAAALGHVIIENLRLGLDPGAASVLTQYERQRRADVATRVMGTQALNRLVSTQNPGLNGLRRLGMKTLDNVSFLKDIAMRHGMAA